ncbi:MAG: malate synthase A, partial [Blastocatellia bacterium]|nr:malate synthase A [Blastocatellia bacterium]
LLKVPQDEITEEGLRLNIDVGIQYLESWLRGIGCVPIYNLMEDAATAEICRAQVWQWIKHGAQLNDGRNITPIMVKQAIADELKKLKEGHAGSGSNKFDLAARLFEQITTGVEFPEFMTLVAYEQLE